MNPMETRQRSIFHIIYGGLLLLAGVGVFFRIPQVMPKLADTSLGDTLPFIRICFYLIGCLLIGGGIKKIHFNYRNLTAGNKNDVSD